MSTTIDQKVVEMRFDNQHFEQNVSTTMSTLDKLKQKLNLNGAAKGMENVNAAAKNVNLSGLGTAVDTVQTKFSAMQVVGVTALANITNSAVNAGKRIVSALTIDPVKTGFQEYETQINAVQTILANTESKGSTIDDVNVALEELNKYADKTIYNFTEMTRNIGTFTAAGVDLDTSVNAIQGIANLAAVSGSTSQQASTAMYQLSQALASGTVKLMDWNSVVNAGMGGEVFPNALKETARVHGVAIDSMIEEQGSFRETLSDGWLTADILTETLSKFTMATEGATEAEIKANREKLKSLGYTDEQIEGIFKLGDTATNAATKVKTFTQLWDVMKESAQSGWAQTWKIIIGDFNEAKEFLTPLSDTFTAIINKMSDWRNDILESALGRGIGKLSKGITSMLEPVTAVSDTIKDTVDVIDDLGTIVDNVILGKFGNGEDRYNALTEAGINYYKVQNKVNEKLGDNFRHSEEAIAAQDKLLGKQEETTKATKEQSKATEKLTDEQKERLKDIAKMTEAEMEAAGYTKEQIQAMKDLGEQAKKLGIPMGEFIDNLDQINGRWLLLNSFKNIGRSIADTFNAIKGAWTDIFPPKTTEEIATGLFNAIAAFHKFTSSLRLVDSETGEFTETGKNLQRTFKGIFAIVDVLTTILGGGLKVAFKVISSILGYFDLDILSVTAAIGDAAVAFNEWFDSLFDITGVLDIVVPYAKKFGETIGSWTSKLKGINIIDKFVEYIRKAKNAIVGFLSSTGDTDNVAANIIAGLVNGLRGGVQKVWTAALEIGKSVLESICSFLRIESPSKEMEEVGKYTIDGFILGIQNGATRIWSVLKNVFYKVIDWVKQADFGPLFAGAIGIGLVTTVSKIGKTLELFAAPLVGLGSLFEGTGDVLSGVGKVLRKSARPIKKILNNTAKVVKSFSNVVSAVAFDIKVEAIVKLTQALVLLIGAIIALTFFDPMELLASVGIVAALALVLVGLAWASNKISSASASFENGKLNINGITTGLLGIGAAILLMAAAVKLMGSLKPEEAKRGFIGLAGVVIALLAVVAAFGLLVKGESAQNIGKFGGMMLKLSIALLLMVGVVKLASKLEKSELRSAGLFLLEFVGFVLAIGIISRLSTENISKMGGMMIKMSLALILMIAVVKLAAELSMQELRSASVFMGGFAVFVGILSLIGAMGGRQIDGVSKMMLGLSVAMLLMIGAVKLIGMMTPDELEKGMTAVEKFAKIIAALVLVSKIGGSEAPKLAGTILAFALAIGILAAITWACGYMTIEGMTKGLIVVGLLSAMMSLMIAATRGANDVKANLIVMAVAIGVMTAAIAALSFIDTKDLAASTIALSMLMGMFALMTKASGSISSAIAPLIVMAGAVSILAGILILMSELKVGSTIETAASLSLLMLTLSACLTVLSKLKVGGGTFAAVGALALLSAVVLELGFFLSLINTMNIGNAMPTVAALSVLISVLTVVLVALTGLGTVIAASGFVVAGGLAVAIVALGLLGLVVLELGAILNAMRSYNLGEAMPMVQSLSALLIVMTGVLAACALIGVLGTSALGGVVAMAALGLVVWELGAILNQLQDYNLEQAMPTVDVLSTFLMNLSKVLGVLTIIGVFAVAAVAGVNSLIYMVTAVGGLMLALGLIATDGVLACLDKGIEVLNKIAYGLGSALGNIVSGFMGSVGDGLILLGMQLSLFMIALEPFIEKVKMVDGKVLAGVGILAATILALTVADLVNGIAEFSPFSDGLAQLGTDLSTFMSNAQGFIEGAAKIDPAIVDGVKTIAETILLLTAANVVEGLTSWLTGGNSIETFAAQLPILGTGLRQFSENVGTFADDQVYTISCAANAIKTLASAAQEIPNTGGLLGDLVGNNDLGTFAAQFPMLGNGLRFFLTNLGTFTEAEVETINASASAVKTLASAASEIPNTGGLLADLVGDNGLGAFAAQFPLLGNGLRFFLTNIGTFTEAEVETVTCAANAIKTLASAASEIPNSGGLLASIVGDNDLSAFAAQFPILGNGLRFFLTNVGTFTEAEVDTVTCAANAIKSLASAASAIPDTGGLLASIVGDNDLGTFASNFPAVGTGLAKFVENLGTFTEAQVMTVYSGVAAINALAGLANADLKGATKHLSDFGADLPAFAEKITGFCNKMPGAVSMNSAVSNINKLLDAVESIANANSGALSTFADNLKKVGKNAVDKFVEAFTSDSAKTDLKDAAKKLADKVIEGIEDKEDNIKTAGENAAKEAVDGVETQDDDMESAGKDLGSGLARGIKAKETAVYNAGYALGQKAVQGEKDGQKSNSPSKLTMLAGEWLGEGLIVGMKNIGNSVYKAGNRLGNSATDSVSSTISSIASLVNSDIDSQPTIRPVLDLSELRTGVNAIGGMFNSKASIGVDANVGAITNMMNRRSQNGGNDIIVSAIDKLRKDVGNISKPSYNINGITYDDGSAVSEAIQTLIRVAKVERRV